MLPSYMASILKQASEGETSKWADLCTYAVKVDSDLAGDFSTRTERLFEGGWSVVKGEAEPGQEQAAVQAAEFIAKVWGGIKRLDTSLRSMARANIAGTSCHEQLWIREGGLFVISRYDWCHYRRFRWDEDWNLRLYEKGSNPGPDQYGERLAPDQWVIHTLPGDGYPGERGLMQSTAWDWLLRRWAEKWYSLGVERFGQPTILGKVPPNTPDAVRNDLQTNLENVSYDGVAIIEEGVEIVDSLGPGTANNGDMYANYLDRKAKAYTKRILGAEDMNTPGTHGSQSAVEGRIEAVADPITEADGKALADSIEQQSFVPLLRYNLAEFDGVMPPIPHLVFGPQIEAERLPEVQDSVSDPEDEVEQVDEKIEVVENKEETGLSRETVEQMIKQAVATALSETEATTPRPKSRTRGSGQTSLPLMTPTSRTVRYGLDDLES
jgi:phage gp29-like protein